MNDAAFFVCVWRYQSRGLSVVKSSKDATIELIKAKNSLQAAFFPDTLINGDRPHYISTLALPRSINLLKPWFCLMFPNTGYTSKQCLFRFCMPCSLFNSACTFCFNRFRFSLISIIRLPLDLWQGTVQQTGDTATGRLLSFDVLLKSGGRCSGISTHEVHLLTHRADVAIFILVIKKLTGGKGWPFVILTLKSSWISWHKKHWLISGRFIKEGFVPISTPSSIHYLRTIYASVIFLILPETDSCLQNIFWVR